MAGQHLAVGVDVHALALGLLQELFQVVEVVAADDDEGALLHGEAYLCGDGGAVGLAVGPVQELHADEVNLAHLHAHGQKVVHGVLVRHGHQCLVEALGNPLVCVAQHGGVVAVGGNAPQSEEN